MRFAPTADQLDLAAALREALAESSDPAGVIEGMGLLGLLVPESEGGAGGDENLLVTVLTEIGYAGASLPAVDTLAFAPGLVPGLGSDGVGSDGVEWVAADVAGTGRVDRAVDASHLLVGGVGGRGPVRVLRAGPVPEEVLPAVDPGARLMAVSGDEVAVVEDAALVERAWLRAVVGSSAELVGLARRMLDLTVAYVGQRQQFGVPVGSFQAVKHHVADVALAVEFAAPVVASAAAMLAGAGSGGRADGIPGSLPPVVSPDVPGQTPVGITEEVKAEVSAAKVLASDAALLAARRSIQCHGAIGYTTEYELHRFVKRAWALAAAWGSADDHRAVVADLVIPA